MNRPFLFACASVSNESSSKTFHIHENDLFHMDCFISIVSQVRTRFKTEAKGI